MKMHRIQYLMHKESRSNERNELNHYSNQSIKEKDIEVLGDYIKNMENVIKEIIQENIKLKENMDYSKQHSNYREIKKYRHEKTKLAERYNKGNELISPIKKFFKQNQNKSSINENNICVIMNKENNSNNNKENNKNILNIFSQNFFEFDEIGEMKEYYEGKINLLEKKVQVLESLENIYTNENYIKSKYKKESYLHLVICPSGSFSLNHNEKHKNKKNNFLQIEKIRLAINN